MITALICGHSFGDVVRDFGPMFALVGVAVTLLVNGTREERRRRREIHARPLEAVAPYYEMPFLVRRRRHDEPSAERVRLTERFADVQAELASCEALMRADQDSAVRNAYAALVTSVRAHAGAQASSAWDGDGRPNRGLRACDGGVDRAASASDATMAQRVSLIEPVDEPYRLGGTI